MNIQEWRGKRVLVVGMARSGIAATKLLADAGAMPIINDSKSADQLGGALDELRGLPCQWRLGEPALELLDGCDAVVISPGVPIGSPFIREAKARKLPVVGELELGFLFVPGRYVAITGTNGKTTTASLMAEICKNAGMLTWLAGNIGYPLTALAGKTRPEDVVVAEVSSFQCESFDTFHPQVAAVLNLTEDHIDRHGTMEAYAALKRRVFERQDAQNVAVLNWDDARCREMAQGILPRVAWFSRREPVAYGTYLSDQNEIVVAMNGVSKAICSAAEVQLPGPHNLENALAAAAMSAALGVPLPVIRHTLRSFAGVEHRMETVRELGGVRYINDSKGTNVDATLRAIESMTAPTVLILGGSDKHVDFTPLAQSVCDHPMIRRVVLIGETAPKIALALDSVQYKGYVHEGSDMEAALRRCREQAEVGWNVLLSPACASFDMFQDFEHRGRVFKQLVSGLQ